MAYLGKTPSQAVRSRYYFTATGGETSLSGADDNANTLTFTDGNYVDVALNGVTLVASTDYNTTTANTIGGLTALVASDVVEVIVYDTFSVFGGNMAANLNFKDNVKANFGTGNDLQIYHDGSNSIINDAGTGSLKFQYGGTDGVVFDSSGNVGIGTTPDTTPSTKLHIREDDAVDYKSRAVIQGNDQRLVAGSHWQFGVAAYSYLQATNDAETVPNSLLLNPDGGNVGIGGSPTENFEVFDAVTHGTAKIGQLMFKNSSGNYAASTDGVHIFPFSDGNTYINNFDGGFVFRTGASVEKMRIDGATGNVGIGVSDPSQAIDLVGSSNSGSGSVRAGGAGSGTQAAFIAQAQFGSASFGTYANYPAVLNSSNNPVVYFNTNASGRAVFAEGITFNGDTAAANALDDYEIGAWNPSFTLGSGTATGVAYGRYLKVGQLVYATFYLQITSGSGNIDYITNLPFAAENSGSWTGIGNVRETSQTGLQWHTYVNINQNYMLLRRYDNTNAFAINYAWTGSVTYTTA